MLLGIGILAAIALSPAAMAAPTVTSLTLSPSTVPGGSGQSSTATVRISEPAPAGGTLVTINTSNPGLAASVKSVKVPQGATTANFTVATNPKYRRYSALAFAATISASAGGTTASAALNVTSQARPADINGDSVQRFGRVCGGSFPASAGDHGILFDCEVGPNFGTVGKCSFRQECLLGCTTRPSDNFQFFDVCASSGPYPIQVSPTWVEGGNPATPTLFLASPAPAGTTAFASSTSSMATVFPTGYAAVPVGATSRSFTAATSIVPSVEFVELDANFEIPTPLGGGSTHMADRTGLTWLAVAPPPENAPAVPQPVLGFLTVDPDQVDGGADAYTTVWLSGVVQAGANPVVVTLTSSHPAIAPVPPSVTISQGSNVSSFSIHTTNPAQTTTVTITASEGTRSVTETLVIAPSTCVPTTCASQGKQCGTASNGCGGSLDCGTCPSGDVCTFQNLCCTPTTCASQGKNCGNINDGCGGFPDCGTCTPPETCQFGVCGCTPTTCAAQGKNCGNISDGCGGTLSCGTCTAPQTCGGGGTPNVCGGGGGASGNTGLRSPTSNAADGDGDRNGFESSPTNAYASDGLSALDRDSGSGSSTSCTDRSKDKHRFWSYGFTFPGGVSIRGIEVRLDAKVDSTSGSPKMCVQLSWDGGNSWTSTKSTPTLGTSTGTYTLGGATDTWGRSWTTGNLSNSSFRVRISDVSSSTSRDFSLDWVAVRVHYQ